jgi:hypothetical protein
VDEKTNSLSETTPSGGTRANKTGNRLEAFVTHTLTQDGYGEFWDHKAQVFANRGVVGGKQFAQQVYVGDTIYKTERYVDFLVVNKDLFPDGLIIECKWQQSNGSVDEKYPFLVWNIIKTKVPTIILIDGGGYKPAALEWLKDQANPSSALIGVYTMAEFQKAANNGLFTKPNPLLIAG